MKYLCLYLLYVIARFLTLETQQLSGVRNLVRVPSRVADCQVIVTKIYRACARFWPTNLILRALYFNIIGCLLTNRQCLGLISTSLARTPPEIDLTCTVHAFASYLCLMLTLHAFVSYLCLMLTV